MTCVLTAVICMRFDGVRCGRRACGAPPAAAAPQLARGRGARARAPACGASAMGATERLPPPWAEAFRFGGALGAGGIGGGGGGGVGTGGATFLTRRAPDAGPRTYLIRRGDTLYTLARKNTTTIKARAPRRCAPASREPPPRTSRSRPRRTARCSQRDSSPSLASRAGAGAHSGIRGWRVIGKMYKGRMRSCRRRPRGRHAGGASASAAATGAACSCARPPGRPRARARARCRVSNRTRRFSAQSLLTSKAARTVTREVQVRIQNGGQMWLSGLGFGTRVYV